MNRFKFGRHLARPGALATAVLSLYPITVFCQPPQANESAAKSADSGTTAPGKTLDRVEVAGQQDLRRAASGMKYIVTAEELKRFSDASALEVLRRVPGITVSGAPGRASEVRLQGLGAGYTQILINGEPAPQGFSLDSLPTALIERIEVVRAPTADMSGQAIAGAINVILRQKATSTQELKTSWTQAGGQGSQALDGQWSGKQASWSWGLGGSLSKERNEWISTISQTGLDPDDADLVRTRRRTHKNELVRTETFSLAPRVAWKPSDAESLNADLLARFRRTRAGVQDARTTLAGDPPLYVANDLRLKAENTSVRSRLSWTRQLSEDTKLEIRYGLQYGRRPSDARFFGFDADGGTVLDEHTTGEATDTSLTLAGKLRTAIDNHSLAVGWDAERGRRDESRIQRQSAPAGYPAMNLDETYDARVNRLALFVQDEWEIRQGLTTYLGLRWEGLRTRSDGNGMEAVANRSSVFSPVLQINWKPSKALRDQWRLSLGRTYRAPSTRDLMPRRYVANDNTPTTPDQQGNPDLRPELAWGADTGYDHYIGEAGMVGLSANLRRIRDVIQPTLSLKEGKWISTPANQGTATSGGVQAEGRFSLRKWDKTLPDMDVRGSLGWNWSSVKAVPGPGNRLDKQDPFVANLGIDLRPGAAWAVGANVTWQEQAWARLSSGERVSNGGKRQLDVYGLWKVRKGLSLRLSGTNLLARDYVTTSVYPDADGEWRQRDSLATYRAVKLTLEASF